MLLEMNLEVEVFNREIRSGLHHHTISLNILQSEIEVGKHLYCVSSHRRRVLSGVSGQIFAGFFQSNTCFLNSILEFMLRQNF